MVFAALAAHDVYQLMPAKHQVPGHGVSLFKVFILDRSMVWPIVFFGLWRLVYVVLLRVMEMNPPKYPQNVAYPPPPDPEAPEFPQKSPLIQM